MPSTDKDLILRVIAHDDRAAFGALVQRYQSPVRGFLRQLTNGNEALADDLAQDTFVQAYRSLPTFRGTSAFSTWVLGIAHNHFRKRPPTRSHCPGCRPRSCEGRHGG